MTRNGRLLLTALLIILIRRTILAPLLNLVKLILAATPALPAIIRSRLVTIPILIPPGGLGGPRLRWATLATLLLIGLQPRLIPLTWRLPGAQVKVVTISVRVIIRLTLSKRFCPPRRLVPGDPPTLTHPNPNRLVKLKTMYRYVTYYKHTDKNLKTCYFV